MGEKGGSTVIKLDSNNPPLGIWYVALPGGQSDFMGCLQPHPDEGGVYVFDCRFRYYHDDKVFDSDDEKHWWHVEDKTSGNADEAIHKIRSVVLKLAAMAPRDEAMHPEVTELLYRDYNDFGKFMRAFQDQPFAYAKMESKEKLDELLKQGKQ
jgi:hypothetical protein